MTTINIEGLDKVDVLMALYHRGKYQGLGGLEVRTTLTPALAKQLLEETEDLYFDYVFGRVMKVDLSETNLDVWLYDRDNGAGAAAAALAHLLKE